MTSAHEPMRVRAGFGKIVHGGAAAVDQDMVGVGPVEIHFRHVPLPIRESSHAFRDSSWEAGGESG